MINLEQFNKLEVSGKSGSMKSRYVELFLRDHKDNAFTLKEILDALREHWKDSKSEKLAISGLSAILNNMLRKDIVEHRKPYWKIKGE